MKKVLRFFVQSNNEYEIFKYEFLLKKDEIIFSINVILNEKYNDVTTNYDYIRSDMRNNYNMCDPEDDYIEFYKRIIDKDDDYFKRYIDNVDYISFAGDIDVIISFIKNNKESFNNKKLILDQEFDISDDFSIFNGLDILFKIKGNSDVVSLDKVLETKNIINKICNYIKQFNLSQLENIMLVYDLVRNRKYTKEEEEENLKVSRDLTDVLLGDKIVCVGYANLFSTILNNLGIKCNNFKLVKKDGLSGHALNSILVNDDKYNINGLYYFDTTWDSKKDDNNFLLSYKYFLNTRREMLRYHSNYIDKKYGLLDTVDYNSLIDKISDIGISTLSKDEIDFINSISNIIDNKKLISPIELYNQSIITDYLKKLLNVYSNLEIARRLIYYEYMLYPKKSRLDMIKLIYNVRKIEYYINPDKYHFSMDDFYKIYINSNYSKYSKDKMKVLMLLLGDDLSFDKDDFNNYAKKINLDKNIEDVKLVKTLRKILENKKNHY